MSTAFHAQMDGASEGSIRTIVQILRSMISPDQKDWIEKVPMVEFAINSSEWINRVHTLRAHIRVYASNGTTRALKCSKDGAWRPRIHPPGVGQPSDGP